MSAANDLLASLVGAPATNGAAPKKELLRALAWARVSSDQQAERGQSIPEQLRAIREYADCREIVVIDEFQEIASAFQREDRRVEFHRMLERAKTDPAVNAILVHDFSRFSRDSHRARALVRELRDAHIQVLSVTDPVAELRNGRR